MEEVGRVRMSLHYALSMKSSFIFVIYHSIAWQFPWTPLNIIDNYQSIGPIVPMFTGHHVQPPIPMIHHSLCACDLYHGFTRSGCCVNSNPNLPELAPPDFQSSRGERKLPFLQRYTMPRVVVVGREAGRVRTLSDSA